MDFEIKTIGIEDENYPELLKKIPNPPKKLFYRGQPFSVVVGSDPTTTATPERCIAIVGSRNPTAYGKQVALEFSRFLSKNGLIIVSGLAMGIDAIAHQGCLETNSRTIAVLGSGIDDKTITPARNKNLAKQILEKGGLILSEYPEGTPGLSHHFPARNRIIAGLSLGILVVEAKEKSGALITADFGLKYKRKVFAIPGTIYSPLSKGCNKLIQANAILANEPKDILDNLGISEKEQKKLEMKFSSPFEKLICEVLQEKPLSIEEIIAKSRQPAEKILQNLVLLEMEDKIQNLGGNIYSIKK
ncbi:MAG: DNA-processing protein DprA [bacterium]|nr:DNA-processing protein DprA [bacterium]